MIYHSTFVVRGRGFFPLDMLRYDGCHPAFEIDSTRITQEDDTEPRDVTVRRTFGTRSERKAWAPTEGRWRSFGWGVVPFSLATVE